MWARQITLHDCAKIISNKPMLPPLASTLKSKLLMLEIKNLNYKSGILLDKKDSKISHRLTIKELQVLFSLSLLSIDTLLKIYKDG